MNIWAIDHPKYAGNIYVRSFADTEADFVNERLRDAGNQLSLPLGGWGVTLSLSQEECTITKFK